jgi:hypothetical protein
LSAGWERTKRGILSRQFQLKSNDIVIVCQLTIAKRTHLSANCKLTKVQVSNFWLHQKVRKVQVSNSWRQKILGKFKLGPKIKMDSCLNSSANFFQTLPTDDR